MAQLTHFAEQEACQLEVEKLKVTSSEWREALNQWLTVINSTPTPLPQYRFMRAANHEISYHSHSSNQYSDCIEAFQDEDYSKPSR
ncbi:hypothetical protein Ciccas_009511 [Cichlidogyrus casuarinus]|uniref:Uncharacterized protein n=1 Tax=Cichlidogyrus casuarinus TaxID=1844966 RepID=A0ABD2PXB3_9PLAT